VNLRLTGGKIPVRFGNTIMLVDPPDRGLFDLLIGKRINAKGRDTYWKILHERLSGKTFKEVAADNGVTGERVRQMEAKMVRMLSDHFLSTISLGTGLPGKDQPLNDSR